MVTGRRARGPQQGRAVRAGSSRAGCHQPSCCPGAGAFRTGSQPGPHRAEQRLPNWHHGWGAGLSRRLSRYTVYGWSSVPSTEDRARKLRTASLGTTRRTHSWERGDSVCRRPVSRTRACGLPGEAPATLAPGRGSPGEDGGEGPSSGPRGDVAPAGFPDARVCLRAQSVRDSSPPRSEAVGQALSAGNHRRGVRDRDGGGHGCPETQGRRAPRSFGL